MMTLPHPLGLSGLVKAEPPQLDFVLPGFKRGTVGAVVSMGGVGKSYWGLTVSCDLALATNLSGLNLKPGKVLYLAAEDDEDVLALRFKAISSRVERWLSETHTLKATQARAKLAGLEENLDCRSCIGLSIDLVEADWLEQVQKAATGARLLVLDTLSRFHNLDENSAADMKRLMSTLEKLAQRTGAGVLYLHHTSKVAVTQGFGALQQAARGSSVLVDNARWVSFMAPMTEQEARRFGIQPEQRERYVRWNISKQNYGPARPDVWYQRDENGALAAVTLQPQSMSPMQADELLSAGGAGQPAMVMPPSATNAFGNQW